MIFAIGVTRVAGEAIGVMTGVAGEAIGVMTGVAGAVALRLRADTTARAALRELLVPDKVHL